MKLIKHDSLTDEHFEAVVKQAGIDVEEMQDYSYKVPHAFVGSARKMRYYSPKSNRMIYVLERVNMVPPDSYVADTFQFESDFTLEEAINFIKKWDEREKEKYKKLKESIPEYGWQLTDAEKEEERKNFLEKEALIRDKG